MLAVIAVLVAVAGAFGGLRKRPMPVKAAPGKTIDQGLYKVQVLDARSGKFAVSSFEKPANKLVVRMRVTNVGDESHGVSIFLEGIVVQVNGRRLQADFMGSNGQLPGGSTSYIHPHLPVTVQAVWPLPDGLALPSVTVGLRKWTYGQGFTNDSFSWTVTSKDPIVTTVTVPVRSGATS